MAMSHLDNYEMITWTDRFAIGPASYFEADQLPLIDKAAIVRIDSERTFAQLRIKNSTTKFPDSFLTEKGFEIIGCEWVDVWKSKYRNKIFTCITSDLGQISLSRAIADSQDREFVAIPPGMIQGDILLKFTLSREGLFDCSAQLALKLRESVNADNRLGEEQKKQINGYIKAIEAILEQPRPDERSISVLAERLLEYTKSLPAKIAERVVVSEIIEFIGRFL